MKADIMIVIASLLVISGATAGAAEPTPALPAVAPPGAMCMPDPSRVRQSERLAKLHEAERRSHQRGTVRPTLAIGPTVSRAFRHVFCQPLKE